MQRTDKERLRRERERERERMRKQTELADPIKDFTYMNQSA